MGRGEWKRLSVSEIAEINPRRQVRIGETVPFVEMAAIRTDLPHVDYVSEREAKGSGSRFTNGDTLFARITPCTENGKTSFVDYLPDGSVGMGSTEFIVLGPRRDLVEPKYLYWLARSELIRKPAIANMIGTSGRQRVPTRVFDEITVPVPPIEVQQRTTEILDSVDEAIKSTRAVIEQTRKVKQGMLQKLLTRGIGHTRFKQTEIGEVPEGWEVRRLGDLIPKDAIRNGLYKPSSDYGEGAPIIRIDAFQNGDTIGAAGLKRVQVTPGELAAYGVQKGDVLINRVNSLSHLGKVGIVGELHRPTVFESNMMCIRLPNTSGLLREYLLYLLASERGRSLVYGSAKHAVAQASINQQDIRSFTFALPPVAEQERFINIVAAENKAAVEQKRWLDLLHSVRSGLISGLLWGHVRVTATV